MSAEMLTALATLIAALAAAVVSVITALRAGKAEAASVAAARIAGTTSRSVADVADVAREVQDTAHVVRADGEVRDKKLDQIHADGAVRDEKLDQIHRLVNGGHAEALALIAQLRQTIANLTRAAGDQAAAERAAVDAGNAPPAKAVKKSPPAHPLTD